MMLDHLFDPRGMMENFEARDRYIRDHGYVRASAELVEFLGRHGPWMEIGAGTGSMAKSITNVGGRVIATDAHVSHGGPGWHGRHFPVHRIPANRAVRISLRHPRLGILTSWPSYDEDWCYQAVRLMRLGQKLAYIGESQGGCTGDDQLHDLMQKDFEVIDSHEVEQFWGMRDHCVILQRIALTV